MRIILILLIPLAVFVLNCSGSEEGSKESESDTASSEEENNSPITDQSSNRSTPDNVTEIPDRSFDPNEFVEAHNYWRSQVGVSEIQWSEELATYAQEWADYLKQEYNCEMHHRSILNDGEFDRENYGENLHWAYNSNTTPSSVVESWADERHDYSYEDNSCESVCGHYTQIVWANSKEVGCGTAQCGDEEVWVCNYNPPGNYIGQKPY